MFLFAGDSHARQFQVNAPGTWGHVSFSGVTVKGLGAAESGHGGIIRYMAAMPTAKTLFIMLGAVDMDVTFYRAVALGAEPDLERFLGERVAIYRAFVDGLEAAAAPFLDRICVLAPQLTPLRDDAFVPATAAMAQLEKRDFAVVRDRIDCSHVARCGRQIRFNDLLEAGLGASERRSVHRIDGRMQGEGGLIDERFIQAKTREHHADPAQTLPLWQDELQSIIPYFAVTVRRRLRAADEVERASA